MKQPSTTTTTEMWQWQCGTCRADWKMLRQVTTTWCPHGDGPHGDGGRCFQGPPPPPFSSAGNPVPHCHHHHHLQEVEGTSSSRALAGFADEGSNADAGRHTTITALNRPAPRVVVAELCWVPDPYLMVQQLREFESLKDELVALRVQLQEYAEEIDKSTRRDDINAGTGTMNVNWLLALPANVRDVVILARDVIESFIAISTSAPPAN